jgi:selenocysteine-specific elongation factor
VGGSLVTGGALELGDEVVLWPGQRQARIRSLQSHERSRERVVPGNRTAANVVGLDRLEVARGVMLGRAGQWRETTLVLGELRTVRSLDEPLTDRGAYHLHFGSGTGAARVRLVEGKQLSGAGAALISLDQPLPMTMGDRFVLRDVGRRAVVAGGRVLDPHPARRTEAARRSLPGLRAAAGGAPDAGAQALLDVRGRDTIATLEADSAGGRPAGGRIVGSEAVSGAEVDRLLEAALSLATEFHEANPLRVGIPKASLASRLGVARPLLERLVAGDGRLEDDGAAIKVRGFAGGWGTEQEGSWEKARGELLSAGAAAPRASQLGLDQELMHALIREERLVRVAEDLVYLPEQLTEIADAIGALPPEFTVAEFRDALAITRRQAVPLLEWLDRTGVTVRDGDRRRLRRP